MYGSHIPDRKKNGKRSFANIEITEVPIGTNGPLVDLHTYTELCDARLPTGKRMSSSDFLGHFLGRTSYDATVKHDSCRFLCLYNQKKSQLPLPIGMSHICQVAGKHSPAVCNVPSACTASVHKMYCGFCINSDSFGQQLLDIWIVFHHLTLGEIL